MSQYSDQEIDLRPYVMAVVDKWYWILGLSLLAGTIAFGATTLLVTPRYEATALVSITEPRQRVQFDPRIITVEENQPLRAYPEIAVSDELLLNLLEELPSGSAVNVQHLRSLLRATPGGDPSLLRMTARSLDAETASTIANEWAELFVSWANRAYGDSGEEQLAFFEQRLQDAESDLQQAEQDLVDYQAQNQSAILENELMALTQAQADLLAKQDAIDLLLQDIDSLLNLFENDTTSQGASQTVDQFTLLMLRLRAFGGVPNNTANAQPWQLQVSPDALAADGSVGQEEQLRSMRQLLESQSEQTATALAELEPEILTIQTAKQEANALESLMLRSVQIAQDTHTALARTVEEKRITSQDSNAGVRLASRSTPPNNPMSTRRTLSALAAAVGVGLLAILIIVMFTWWNGDESVTPAAEAAPQDSGPAAAD